MIQRYENYEIAKIFGDEHKLQYWQDTELAVIKAQVEIGKFLKESADTIIYCLKAEPIDLKWWRERDSIIHHDLNAFIDERLRSIPKNLHKHFHKDMTSYDTEEPAFARLLAEAIFVIFNLCEPLEANLILLAKKYRYILMLARTHGQWAELQSFGARILTWFAEYKIAKNSLEYSAKNTEYSKLSGAIGKYGQLDPRIEKIALDSLGLKPFPGATQIMPRILYAPIAQALSNLVSVIDKISNDIRLAARSGLVLMQEPFGKNQKGSSAMPHKKNTIRTEQIEGLARLARAYSGAISENIRTWEERAIEQSCVERVAWPDLFHVSAQALKTINYVLEGLVVYPDNMLEEIVRARGTIVSNPAKEWLKNQLSNFDMGHEDAYRIIQLASFNIFEPSAARLKIRAEAGSISSFKEASSLLNDLERLMIEQPEEMVSIKDFLPTKKLLISSKLDISAQQIGKYNRVLKKIFANKKTLNSWHYLFEPKKILENEELLYDKIINLS